MVGISCETSIRGLSLDLPEPLPRAKDNPGLRSHMESLCLTIHMWKHSSRVQITAIYDIDKVIFLNENSRIFGVKQNKEKLFQKNAFESSSKGGLMRKAVHMGPIK